MTCLTCEGQQLVLRSFARDRAGRAAVHAVMCPDCLPDPRLAEMTTDELTAALRTAATLDEVPDVVRGLALLAAARLERPAAPGETASCTG